MGQKLHVAKKYEIEYSSSFGFNNKVVEFHNLLTALGISYNGESWDDDVEVNREDLSRDYLLPLKNRILNAWRANRGTKRGKMSLEMLFFTYQ